MHKEQFYKDDDISLEYNISGEFINLHCDVAHWSPSVLKRAYRVFGDFLNEMRKQGYEMAITITPNPKFARLFAGQKAGDYEKDGVMNEVFIWEL